HGDVFMTLYSEVPQSLAVIHDSVLPAGQDFFTISADDSSVIALTVDGEIIGVAEGTGYPVNITISPQSGGETLRVTVTKANHYRCEADVPVVQVGVAEDDTPETPGSVTICSIYPNPFSKQTQIRCMIHDTDRTIQELTLNIYDAAGRLLKSFLLPNSYLLSSTSVVWDGGDVRGNACPSGVYFIELTTEDTNITKKLLLLR
ncbi:MAG: T9SS type A sorting domain-containing protein, partial [candidate division WOR-3 bacterium]|nr:T9SS type A sorting domain-containing protein [candidate division WOR-3 bacterium]